MYFQPMILWSQIGAHRARLSSIRPAGKGIYASARRARRRASGLPSGNCRSISSWVCFQMGRARASSFRPSGVRFRMRLLRSAGSGVIWTNLRRSSGLSAAVSVVRSMASSEATGPIGGGSGRFSDISRENCPLVSPNGRRASSKRRARARAARWTCRQRQQSRTISVVSKGSSGSGLGLDTAPD